MAVAVEAYPNRQTERWPLLGRLRPDAQTALRGLYHAISERDKEKTPTNDFGIVVPPNYVKCIGDDCHFRDGFEECQLDRHHLHSTAPDYETDSELADQFRNQELFTIWLARCIHVKHHEEYRIHVPIPHPDMMRQGKYEAGRVKKLITNYRENHNNEKLLRTTPNLTIKGTRSLNSIRDYLAERREMLLDEVVTGLDVIPEELITGALLLVASDLAQRRINNGMKFALPSLLNRSEVSIALENSKAALAQAA